MSKIRQEVFDLLDIERGRQDSLHGNKNAAIPALAHKRLTLIMEELGESAMTLDYIDCSDSLEERAELIKHYISELTQTGALVVQTIERIKEEYPDA